MMASREQTQKVITRFPPSPTGNLHVGSARTALFNWLFTRKHGGKIILRFEDTDRERSRREYEENIHEGLRWLGLDFDEGTDKPIRQSERTEIYRKYLDKIIAEGKGYISKEPAKDDPGREVEVVRLRNPGSTIVFHDEIREEVTFDTAELGDLVIARNIDEPLYHFTVVVDDFEMDVTHVIRGEDHISNTPRQILIQEAIGAPRPVYAHIPLLLASDRSKLSKRHGAVAVTEYREQGYLPEAFLNYLALLGWSPGENEEIFSLTELVEKFNLSRIQKGGAIFDIEKLKWVNKEHLARLNENNFCNLIVANLPNSITVHQKWSEELLIKLLPFFRERITTLRDIQLMAEKGELQYFLDDPDYEVQNLFWKDEQNALKTGARIERVIEFLQEVPENSFSSEAIKSALWDYATNEGRGDVLWPMRYALSGRDKSPDPFFIAGIIGKEATLRRLYAAIEKLREY